MQTVFIIGLFLMKTHVETGMASCLLGIVLLICVCSFRIAHKYATNWSSQFVTMPDNCEQSLQLLLGTSPLTIVTQLYGSASLHSLLAVHVAVFFPAIFSFILH